MKTTNKLRIITAIVLIITLALIFGLWTFLKFPLLYVLSVYAIFTILIIYILLSVSNQVVDATKEIEKSLKPNFVEALQEAKIGIVTYDEDYTIRWMSSMFEDKHIDYRGEKILGWLPELQELLNEDVQEVLAIINEEKYIVKKKDNDKILFFTDVSKEYDLKKKIDEDAYVLGLISFDNYDEIAKDEEDINAINTAAKLPVMEYLKSNGIVYKTLRNNRVQLVLNEKIYSNLFKDRFSILNTVRKETKKANIDITLSIGFARGTNNLEELDSIASECLDLAQTRGGDQVVVKKVDSEAEFFGGSSEAHEKQSKIKVRVMANTLKNLIQTNDNTIIVCHKYADADCIGAAIGLSSIAHCLNKDVAIVLNTGGIESMIEDVLHTYESKIEDKHIFISEQEALNRLKDNTLVIMVDHHSLEQTNAELVIKNAKSIAVIDHHRRRADFEFSPSYVYVEASASSSTELVVEFLPYISRKISLTEQEANIMYLGIVIDTNHFRKRTGTRTFEVAKLLRQLGADPNECEKISLEPYENVMKRNAIISEAKRYTNNIVISKIDSIYPRSIASQASDDLLSSKEVEAAFVIFYIDNDEVAISARSKGNINVQVILEKMKGGGHMTAAGLQRSNATTSELQDELIEVLNEYFKEGEENESNIAQ